MDWQKKHKIRGSQDWRGEAVRVAGKNQKEEKRRIQSCPRRTVDLLISGEFQHYSGWSTEYFNDDDIKLDGGSRMYGGVRRRGYSKAPMRAKICAILCLAGLIVGFIALLTTIAVKAGWVNFIGIEGGVVLTVTMFILSGFSYYLGFVKKSSQQPQRI